MTNPYRSSVPEQLPDPDELTLEEAESEVNRLREALNHHDRKYYLDNDPVISDHDYDRLFRCLERLEEAFPELESPHSPTRRVGAPPVDELETVEHPVPLLSLSSSLEEDEIRDFDRFLRDQLGHDDFSYFSECKFDGLSVALTYREGRFERGATRGDGIRGEDVTHNLRTVRRLPLELAGNSSLPEELVVRGEIFMRLDPFQQLNERRVTEGKDPFANPRNAAAGTLRQLDPEVSARRPLDLYVFDLLTSTGDLPDTQRDIMDRFRDWGFPVHDEWVETADIDKVIEFRNEMSARRDELPFEIDGTVIKVNELTVREELGVRQSNPRWAMAYKFPPREEETVVQQIGVQVGRTGKLTPVAFLKPVDVGGVTISRASLHNYDEVREKDIREGDRVKVVRAGDVIPYVEKRIDDSPEEERGDPFRMPEECPACGSEVVVEGAYHMCTGGMSCPAQQQGLLEHFVSRDAMDIEGLGEKEIQKLRELDLVSTPADLYELTVEELLEADLFSNETYLRFRREAARPRVAMGLYAADLPGIGPTTAVELSGRIDRPDELLDRSEEELQELGLTSNQADRIGEALENDAVRDQLRTYSDDPERAAAEVGKSVHNLMEEIETSKRPGLDRFLYALGIRHVGRHVARVLAERYDSIDEIMEADEDELQTIEDIGPKVAFSIRTYFDNRSNRDVVNRLLDLGVEPEPLERDEGAQPLEGLTFVFTGSIPGISRQEATEAVETRGGRVTSSVSGNTDYLVVGENPGRSKREDAEEHGTEELSPEEFLDWIEEGE